MFRLVILTLWACGFRVSHGMPAQSCEYPSDHLLAFNIGIRDSELPHVMLFPCDTMMVRKGDTTRIYSSEYLHFGFGSTEKNVLIVKGTLIVEGLPKSRTYFSGSLVQHPLGFKPGDASWAGIIIDSSGSMEMKNVKISGARTPITARSPRVKLKDVEIFGGKFIVMPDKTQLPIDSLGTRIISLNFRASRAPMDWVSTPRQSYGDSPADKAKLASPSSMLKPWLWGGLGVLALSGGAATWYFSNQEKSTVSPESGFPEKPSFDEDPALRP